MAYDIGPRIGIDGEAEFRKQLRTVNESIKTMGSEMKAVTSAFIGAENSIEALTEKNKVLSKTIDAQEDKLEQQNAFLKKAKELYGDNAEETLKWQRAVNEATADLNKMKAQLKENESAIERFGNETEEVADDLGKAAKAGLDFGDVLKANVLGGAILNGIEALGNAVGSVVSSLAGMDEATAEYRENQAKLNTAFEAAGHSAETADKAYNNLFGILGDSSEATEAAQLMASLAKDTKDVDKWTKIAAGTAGRFGDALPIPNLIEAANEAAKTGESVSALDDALNWIGIDAEAFGEQLAATGTEQERLQFITDTLAGAYDEAADSFYKNNEELVRARENEALLAETTGRLGETVSKIKGNLLEEFAPSLAETGEAFADLLEGVDGSDEAFAEAIGGLIDTGAEKLPEFINLGFDIVGKIIEGVLSNPDGIAEAATDTVGALLDGFIENAPEMLVGGAELIGKIFVGLATELVELLHDIPGFVEDIRDEFMENAPTFQQIGRDLWDALFAGWKERARINKLDTPVGVLDYDYGAIDGSHASGLDYVPFDGYVAELHRGEMVLPAFQADLMRSGAATGSGAELATIAAAMVNGIQSVISTNAGAEIRLITPEGTELARYMLPGLIAVADAAGTPIIAK